MAHVLSDNLSQKFYNLNKKQKFLTGKTVHQLSVSRSMFGSSAVDKTIVSGTLHWQLPMLQSGYCISIAVNTCYQWQCKNPVIFVHSFIHSFIIPSICSLIQLSTSEA
jgi:hypothetical protein